MEITHDVTIDLLMPRQNVIRVVQEDSTRTIRLKLLSNNQNYNVADDLDEGETLLKFVEFRKSDGHGGMYDTTSTGETAVELEDQSVPNVWLVNLDGQCFTAPGWTQINVRFETESGKRIHTFAIMVDVEPTASSDTESTDWGDLNSIADLRNAITAMFDSLFPVDAKRALMNLVNQVAWDEGSDGQRCIDELEAALYQTAGVVSISAVFEQGSAVIYDTDDLDTLRQYLTVTATYEDLSTREITGYTLLGTLTAGTSTITVSYGGKTATFDVVVSIGLDSIAYGNLTYRDIFITNNLLPFGDFEATLNLSTTEQTWGGSSSKKYKINAGSPVQSADDSNSPTKSIKCFNYGVGDTSDQFYYKDSSVHPVGKYLMCTSANVLRYAGNGVGNCGVYLQSGTLAGRLRFERVTDGWEELVSILDCGSNSSNTFSIYIGSAIVTGQTGIDAYVDDIVFTPLPSGLTEEQALVLYKKYISIRRGES